VREVLAAAEIAGSHQILDVATGPGEAASAALSQIGISGLVVGVDISMEMLHTARTRFAHRAFRVVMADGQVLPFADSSFDAVICQLGLMFFPDPAQGLREFRRVLRPGHCAAMCVISVRERAPMWGVLAEILSRYLPDQQNVLNLSFALADADRLERLMEGAGFREIRVERSARDRDFARSTEPAARQLPAYAILAAERARPADVEREIAERDCAGADHLDDDRLWQGHDHDVVEPEMRMLRLRPGPGGECADNVVAEQDHEVITLGADHETRRCPDPPDDIEHGVGVSRERANARLLAADEWPDERFQQLWCQPLLRGACRPRG
jgi:ubiquinone/menaquinone biosynthesis C-methylase UbiE